ncbi:MAG: 3-methylaspartate ammonia-lyase [Firmicutes bacterium HGW-Firmicutes-14]|nr:MAG: 3-methylaspartate ammonia-lyase [Firmicutes bacterium HGW-Firmicutes-14]
MREIRILSPTAILGYGFPEESFREGLKRRPDVIAVDAGSTDPGPYYLGAGVSFTDREAVLRDLRLIIRAGRELNIPVLIGSAGGSGAEPHLMWNLDIIREIAEKENLSFKLAVIHAEIHKQIVLDALNSDRTRELPCGLPLCREDVTGSTHIVGQMGTEPFIKALEMGADVVLAGRAYDPAVFAAVPIMMGFDAGLALHMGKILECAAIAATPGSGSDCMIGYLHEDCFLLEPLNTVRSCTVTSVAAHTLYEKSNPYLLPGPGTLIDLRNTVFSQYNPTMVRVSGSRMIPAPVYTIKLEGAQKAGYRTVSIAGARDPVFINQVENIIEGVRARVKDNFAGIPAERYRLLFHIYGKNGVMEELEPQKNITSHELGIIIEAVADSQELANTVCSFARSTMLHYGYRGRISTAGNLAFPYSPSDFKAGEVYRFSLNHLITVEDPCSLFPIELTDIKEGQGWK